MSVFVVVYPTPTFGESWVCVDFLSIYVALHCRFTALRHPDAMGRMDGLSWKDLLNVL